jgi:flagellar protein FlaG
MNTDLVQALMTTATKTASSSGQTSKTTARPATTPVAQDNAAPPKKETEIVPPTQKVQETVKAVAAQIESYLRSVGREVQFSIDSDSGETVITIRDSSTGELVRQIPSAEALRLSQALADRPSLLDTVA